MKLEIRMHQSIKRRSGIVFSRSDVASLGSKTQVTQVLKALIQKGELLRLSPGIYVKARRIADGNVKPLGSLEVIIREAANKLGLVLHTKELSFVNYATLEDEIVVETETPRVSRKMQVNGKTVRFQNYRQKNKEDFCIPPQVIPIRGVANYVLNFAHYHKVSYSYNSMDQWADSVTRLAGDDVKHDNIEDLLVALKRAGKLSKKDVAMLAVNYLRERKQSVRPI